MLRQSFANRWATARQGCKILGASLLVTGLGMVVTDPIKEMATRGYTDCPEGQTPATLIVNPGIQTAANCSVEVAALEDQ